MCAWKPWMPSKQQRTLANQDLCDLVNKYCGYTKKQGTLFLHWKMYSSQVAKEFLHKHIDTHQSRTSVGCFHCKKTFDSIFSSADTTTFNEDISSWNVCQILPPAMTGMFYKRPWHLTTGVKCSNIHE
jgi:hypothetical protein